VSARRFVQRGFTILEMVIVVVILSIVGATVSLMVARVGSGQSENSDLQVGGQLLQECGEWIISNHRRDGSFFTSTLSNSSTCYGLTSFGGFSTPSVTVTAYAGAGCPTGGTCKLAAITVTKSGTSLNPMNIVLVRYNPL